jgi:hypothetical protein
MREFLTEKDLDEIGLFSRQHRDRLRKAGKFPLPIKIGGGPGAKSLTPREDIEALKEAGRKVEHGKALPRLPHQAA